MGTDEGQGAPPAGGMQFDKVELASPEAARACARCKRIVTDEYFEVAGRMVCRECGTELGGDQGGAGPWLRALALGGGAAFLCTIAWYLIVKITNYELGLIAIGVGYFIGLAVRRGSGRRGGWKYQALAMLLTYGSITASKIPFIVEAAQEQDTQGGQGAKDEQADPAKAPPSDSAPAGEHAAPKKPAGAGDVALAFVLVLGIALASPFLMGAKNIIGIIIIGIALYEAWKINRRIPLSGPFRLGPAAPLAVSPSPASGAPPQSTP
jgi:hypothetical protein